MKTKTEVIPRDWSNPAEIIKGWAFLLAALIALLMSASSVYAQSSSLNTGEMLYYTFDEGSGTTANDTSGYGNVGTITNSPWTTGKVGSGALGFDGVSTYVNINPLGALPIYRASGYSVAFWVKGSAANYTFLYGEGNSSSANEGNTVFGLLSGGSGNKELQVYIRDDNGNVLTPPSTSSTSKDIIDGTWHHVAWTDNNGVGVLYIDGVANTNVTYVPSTSVTLNTASIGAIRRTSTESYFQGSMDDFRVYNRVLQSSEVSQLASLTQSSAPITTTPTNTTPPTVSITSPVSGATASEMLFPIDATASDNIKVASVQFQVDGQNIGCPTSGSNCGLITAAPYQTIWNTYTVADGMHTLTAVATDVSGNTATSVPITVTVNNAPSVVPLSPTSSASPYFIPTHGATYYVDYSCSGCDTNNNGLSTSSPWQHAPGDSNGTWPTAPVLNPGDTVYFKKGVSYFGQITVPAGASGKQIAAGTTATVTSSGVFADTNGAFNTTGVLPGDFVYIYHSSSDGRWIESTGLWQVKSIDSNTQLTLSGFNGQPYSIAELPYIISRSISFASSPLWGTGDAILDGSGTQDYIFRLSTYGNTQNNNNFIRFSDLHLQDLRNVPASGCTGESSAGAIWDGGNPSLAGIIGENLIITDVWTGISAAYTNNSIWRNNSIREFGDIGLLVGGYGLTENNTLQDGLSSIRGATQYSVIRYNTIIDSNHPAADSCGYHADGIGPLFSPAASPGSNQYGWIYGNLISNTVEGVFLTSNNGGTSHWTIHSNFLIGHNGYDGSGDSAILIESSPYTRIYNNTIFDINGSEGWISGIHLGVHTDGDPPSNNSEIKNNLIYSLNNSSGLIGTNDSASMQGTIIEGNLYFTPNNTNGQFSLGGVQQAWQQWQAAGYDTTSDSSFNVDPKLVNTVGTTWDVLDLSASSSSPNLSSILKLPIVALDANKNIRTAWTKGAYEYSGALIISVPPTVSLTADQTVPGTVSLSTTASAVAGAYISKVEFFNNSSIPSTLLNTSTTVGTSTTNPYTYSWNSVAAGAYNLTAIAYDSNGASTTSSVVNVTVNASSGTPLYGDVNGAANGLVTIYDTELTAQYAVGLPVAGFIPANAEVDNRSTVDIYDAYLIAEYAVGFINKFPAQNN